MNTFLLENETAYLTGALQPVKQRQWLIDHGYQFDVRLDGKPVVLRSHLEKKLGGVSSKAERRKTHPNLKGLLEMVNNGQKAHNQ